MKTTKYIIAILAIAFSLAGSMQAQNVGINGAGTAPRNCAMLDILSSNTGLLIPTLALTNVATYAPCTGTAVDGLIVYSSTSPTNGSGTGFYYWSTASSKWVPLSGNGSNDWALLGNTGINDPATPATYGTSTFAATENWLGTTDANDIVFGTNKIERMRIKQTTGNLGIGTAAPAQALDIFSKFQVNSSGDAVKIKNIPYSWPATQGAASTTTYLSNDGAGNLTWNAPYGGHVQYTSGANTTSDITTNSSSFADMTGMTITFTPVHSVVFLHFTASGAANLSVGQDGYVECRATNSTASTIYGGCVSLAAVYNKSSNEDGAWNCSMIIPITVTAGTSTTIKVQWMTDGLSPTTATCQPTTYPNYSHRTMVIWD